MNGKYRIVIATVFLKYNQHPKAIGDEQGAL